MESEMGEQRERTHGTPHTSRRQVIIGAGSFATAMTLGPLAAAQPGSGLTAAGFRIFLWKDFVVASDQGAVTFTLTNVVWHARAGRPAALRDPFSLIFRSNIGNLPTGTYEVRRPDGSRIAMFLTPIQQQGDYYEAAFN
jgi:hypothetical protein